ncbi:MAG: hypothetical protein DHS20C11_20240 [Lysobacteraceae bacterium]|nr:MAG: hypothetical protein DHS20C11_20240 [Xanthomonadaceae bacterium]
MSCDYAIDHGTIGDPSPGCEKDFYVFYECNGRFLRTKVGKEASGKSAYLSCDLWTGLQGVELERIVKIQQASSGRYLDSKYPNNSVDDYRVVTSRFSAQSFATQMWSASGPKQVGDCTNAFVFTQVASSRLLDAHININNYGVVTRQSQLSSGRDSEQFASQHWQIQAAGKGLYTIRQCAKGEGEGYLDAFESNENDFRAVTRPDQKNDSQRWLITIMGG